ncbi:hypothetical protein Q4595_21190, partial [Wenyingzhuangia sp. 1_MG-2023]|nr:hypothetical protein [Wenyingzhuangia sp. 1_MG-2023]
LIISTQLLSGQRAVIDPDGAGASAGTEAHCAIIGYRAGTEGENNYLSDAPLRKQAEFCNAEYTPEVGTEFSVNNTRYRIDQIDSDQSTDIITRCWITTQQQD